MKNTTGKVKKMLRVLFANENQSTPFIQGVPGIGKSQIIEQVRKELGFDHLLDIRLSQHENVDIKGIPHVQDNGSLTWISPDFMPVEGSIWEGTSGILFFDEINRAQPDTQSSVFQAVQDGYIGTKKILDSWRVAAAGNYGYEDGTDVYEMDSALRNRFINIEMDVPTIEEWLEWANENGVNSFVKGFLEDSPRYLYQEEEKFLITPRTWEKFSSILNTESENAKNLVLTFGPSMIGSSYNAFYNYIEKNEMLNGKDVIENYDKCKEKLNNMERNDIHRLNTAIIDYIKNKKRIYKKNIHNFYEYIHNYLTDDNIVSIIYGLRDAGCEKKFLDKFFDEYEKECDEEGTRMNDLIVKGS